MPNISNFRWRAMAKKDDPKTGEIFIYSVIDDTKWDPEDTTPASFKSDLDKLGDIKQLNIYINSPGGSPFAAAAIFNIIERGKKNFKVTTYNDGLAASAASIILMTGDKIIMPANALTMIHRAWTIGIGNANDFFKLATDLDIIDNTLADVYKTKNSKLSKEEIMKLLDAETWMNAQEMADQGFDIEPVEEKQVAACIKGDKLIANEIDFDIQNLGFKNFPVGKLPQVQNEIEPNSEQPNIKVNFVNNTNTKVKIIQSILRNGEGGYTLNIITEPEEPELPPIADHKPEENPTQPSGVFDLQKHIAKINQLTERRKNHERKA